MPYSSPAFSVMVAVVYWPAIPSSTAKLISAAGVPKRIMRVPTAVPNTLAASLAPSDQPRKSPLVRNKIAAISMGF